VRILWRTGYPFMSSPRPLSSLAVGAASCLLFTAAAAAGAQNPPSRPGTSKPFEANRAEHASSKVEVINGPSRVIRDFNAPATTSRLNEQERNATTGTRVEVINGEAERTVVLNPSEKPALTHRLVSKRASWKSESALPSAMTAEILNGTRRETRVFDAGPDAFDRTASARHPHPVVIGVASSTSEPVVVGIAESGHAVNNTRPVVIRVASSGSESEAGTAVPVVVGIQSSEIAPRSSEAEPVAIDIAPRPPKRPPYRRPTPSP
jgi:hypothetical protein